MMSANRPRPETHVGDFVQANHGGGRVDGIHHVVERDGEGVNVFAVEWSDERPVQTVDDAPCLAVTDVLDLLMVCAFAMSGGSLASICWSVTAPSAICCDMATNSLKNSS
jgi:hypothetical protein